MPLVRVTNSAPSSFKARSVRLSAIFCDFALIQINAEQIALKQASDHSSFRSSCGSFVGAAKRITLRLLLLRLTYLAAFCRFPRSKGRRPVRCRIPQDPGGAGKLRAHHLVGLLQGYIVPISADCGCLAHLVLTSAAS